VAQLSLMMQNARRLKDNPEFQEDMLATVENSLEKMRRLMLQLREGGTPVGVASGVPLEPIVRRIEAAARSRGRVLGVSVTGDVTTRGHEERLERVIGHLVDNAFDATQPEGEVRVALGCRGSQAEVVVTDTGKGMSEEFIRTRLFKPFQSTKHSGMGIGAFESFEYIRELGGQVEVDSEEGRGTTIRVSLPLFHAGRGSDLGLNAR
jgi:putative PEP-CTERM system histidine kinase